MNERAVIGWDIGGVNTKVARVARGVVRAAHSEPFEIQRDPHALTPLLRSLAAKLGAADDDRHAVTMTAELSQMFRTKRDGVSFVLDAVTSAFPSSEIAVYTVDGRFVSPSDGVREPLAVAASNWAATANVVAADHRDAILIDIGTTTTDIIPIVDGVVVAGSTDPARLASGELVYSGALRTPVEAIVHDVPIGGSPTAVSAESFALIGDVYVWRGELAPNDYSVATPDGRPASREFAAERIARIVCADREMLDENAISSIADAIAQAQAERIAQAISRVRDRHRALRLAVVTGLGAFIAERAARRAGLEVVRLAETLGADASRCAPAAAVALLLARDRAALTPDHYPGSTPNRSARSTTEPAAHEFSQVDVVVKIGGGLLANPDLLDATLGSVIERARALRAVVVPGGGPFADAVRDVDRRVHLPDDVAHWMAVLAMDQYAHVLTARRRELTLATSPEELDAALSLGRVPVLAPFRWLREADPLPHSWDVTSDSIAAWFASTLGAKELVLVKPPGADLDDAVDPYFSRALSRAVKVLVTSNQFQLPVTDSNYE